MNDNLMLLGRALYHPIILYCASLQLSAKKILKETVDDESDLNRDKIIEKMDLHVSR